MLKKDHYHKLFILTGNLVTTCAKVLERTILAHP